MINFYTLLLCATLPFIAVGCDTEPPVTFDEFCDSRELSLCDISQDSCIQPLSEFVACLRERPLVGIPRIEIMSEDAWREEAIAYLESDAGQNREYLITALELFDRFPSTRPTREERIESHLENKMIMREPGLIELIDNGNGFASESHYLGFVQLLTLMMLQQEYDLDGLNAAIEGNPSRQSHLNSVVLGAQALYANMVFSALQKNSYWSYIWSAVWQEARENTYTSILSGEIGLGEYAGRQAPLPRFFGAEAVHRAWILGQTSAVEELFASPPRFTDPSSTQLIVDALPALDSGLINYEQVSDFVMGSWFTPLFLSRLMPEEQVSLLNTSSWSADRLWVFHRSFTETTAAIWIWVPQWSGDTDNWASSLNDYATANEKPWLVSTKIIDGQNVLALACIDHLR